jgi:hypothetical protein
MMLRKIRVTPSMVVAVIALVFAATGGALAATSSNDGASHAQSLATAVVSKAKPKAKVKAGPRGPAGPAGKAGALGATGPAGPAGATGPAGAVGPTGAAGTNGTDGTNGKEGPEGPEGPEGSPWTVGGALPSGQSESGTWAVRRADNAFGEKAVVALSYGIRLAVPPEEGSYIVVGETPPPGCKGGTAAEPKALPGNLCIFEGEATFDHAGGLGYEFTLSPAGGGVGTTGAEMLFKTKTPATVGEEVSAEGTWVVTAK